MNMTTNLTDISESGGAVLTAPEAALFLRISESIVRRLIRERRIPYFKIEGQYLFYRPALEVWMSLLTITPDGGSPPPRLNSIGHVVAHSDLESNSSGSEGNGSAIPKVPNPDNMTLAEAAYYLGVSRSTLYKWTSGNKIPYRKIGRKILSFTKKELDDFIARRKIASQDELADLAQESIDLLKLPKRIRGS